MTIATSVRLTIANADLEFSFSNSIAEMEDRWVAFEKVAVGTPFQNFAWLKNWHATIGAAQGVTPFIACGYQNGNLAIILPLCIKTTRISKCLTWLGEDLNDYNMPLIAEDLYARMTSADAGALLKMVSQAAGNADYMYSPKLPEQQGGRDNPFSIHQSMEYTVGSHSVRLTNNFDDFYSGVRGAKARRRLRSKETKLAKLGCLEYCQPTDAADKAEAIRLILTWKAQQLDETGALNPFNNTTNLALFDNLARDPAAADHLRVYALKVDGEYVAAAFGFMCPKSFVLYQTAYKTGPYTAFSPGTLLLLHMFRSAIDEGKSEFDFSLGNEAYKFEWADTHAITTVGVTAMTAKGFVIGAALKSFLFAKRWIKASPKRFAFALRTHAALLKAKEIMQPRASRVTAEPPVGRFKSEAVPL